jgi:hypothetical protein
MEALGPFGCSCVQKRTFNAQMMNNCNRNRIDNDEGCGNSTKCDNIVEDPQRKGHAERLRTSCNIFVWGACSLKSNMKTFSFID